MSPYCVIVVSLDRIVGLDLFSSKTQRAECELNVALSAAGKGGLGKEAPLHTGGEPPASLLTQTFRVCWSPGNTTDLIPLPPLPLFVLALKVIY